MLSHCTADTRLACAVESHGAFAYASMQARAAPPSYVILPALIAAMFDSSTTPGKWKLLYAL